MFLVNWCVNSSPSAGQKAAKRRRKERAERAPLFVQCLCSIDSLFSLSVSHLALFPLLLHALTISSKDLLGPQLARPLQQKRQDPVFGKRREEDNLFFFASAAIDRSARRRKKKQKKNSSAFGSSLVCLFSLSLLSASFFFLSLRW